jgi:uncharacterized integral membrane protein
MVENGMVKAVLVSVLAAVLVALLVAILAQCSIKYVQFAYLVLSSNKEFGYADLDHRK